MRVHLSTRARKDLESILLFQEGRSPGLGDYFLVTLLEEWDRLERLAGVHEMVGRYHRMITRKFDCSVYYRVTDSQILVDAILPSRRNPDWIALRLENPSD